MFSSRTSRLTEFILLFYALPILIYFDPFKLPKIPVLLFAAAYVIYALRTDASFDNRLFWNFDGFRKSYKETARRIAVISPYIFLLVLFFWKSMLFGFVMDHFWLWLAVIILYPVFSAYPQELIYRVFFFHRYSVLFGKPWVMILMSALSFGFLHIIYRNWIAVAFTFCGGIIFAVSYYRNRSAAAVTFEHGFYGDLIFTLGIGGFFYNG